MESHKSKVLRIANTIYDIECGTIVTVTNSNNNEYTFKQYGRNYRISSLWRWRLQSL